ncbi:MAG: TetR/AcrR family transcriptional regulator [Pseudomonadota bacterium]|uniref:TetR/AcrR family transcriptional regulator n=1 Tax=Phenylobacterium sp. TaxID=1871053 RepID=UPI002721DF11|nr:TetR/AcrR family transcriptional regulator [Phenylobacterium sp.]MDO9431436.1 TetR/AcrR family transcriptional regulator [Phenylobacterium sp.]
MSEVAYLPAGKRELTKVANRQAILDAAREVFGELGYETATVRDIIRRTGLAAGTFYNYYRSKDEVYLALSAEGARQFAPLLKAQRAQSADWSEFVRAAIGAYFLFLTDAHKTWLARRPPEEVVPHVHGETPEMAAVFNEVREAIVEEIAKGRAPAADPDYVAAACIAIARDVGERMLTRRPIDTEGATEFAVAMIQGGLQGLPQSKA